MRVALLHYHLRPGGVTRVMEMAVSALSANGADVLVLSGEAPPDNAFPCAFAVVPELNYGASLEHVGRLCEGVDTKCRARWGAPPDVLHVHNHSLGKSLSLPGAVAQWATEGRSLILQMHDFAENGRPANYAYLRQGFPGGLPLYPCGGRVRPVVLTQWAAGAIAAAGGKAAILPNPVDLPRDGTPVQASVFSAQRLIVYPTRGITRKNLGEALLLAAGFPQGTVLAISSAPSAGPERAQYESWRRLAQELELPVVFDAASKVGCSVYDLLSGADLCLTTSIEEGFGMAFLEPWAATRPLAGRDLQNVTADLCAAGLNLQHLYKTLPMPADPETLLCVVESLEQRRREAALAYGVTPRTWGQTAASSTLDFGEMPVSVQRALLRKARRGEVQVPSLHEPDHTTTAHNCTVVRKGFSLEAYGKNLLSLYDSVVNTRGTPQFLNPAGVLDYFLNGLAIRTLDPRRT